MRRFAVVVALVVGFAVVTGQFSSGVERSRLGAVVRVFAIGALSGITVGIGDYIVSGVLTRGEAQFLAAERENDPGIDWLGKLAGFGALAWFAWQWFGRTKQTT